MSGAGLVEARVYSTEAGKRVGTQESEWLWAEGQP